MVVLLAVLVADIGLRAYAVQSVSAGDFHALAGGLYVVNSGIENRIVLGGLDSIASLGILAVGIGFVTLTHAMTARLLDRVGTRMYRLGQLAGAGILAVALVNLAELAWTGRMTDCLAWVPDERTIRFFNLGDALLLACMALMLVSWGAMFWLGRKAITDPHARFGRHPWLEEISGDSDPENVRPARPGDAA